ncbi:DUF294 nucleotidyltransferase-like domain-containing protein [Oceanobacillus halophilus]|uniref:CBS domain-containing protein n=1 Tax=Oceanobacillus halophilus TaxID=930130 RepID=A0A495A7N0_9BACI|nr:DUF294 nucleotidyltransferase-like domain-containing protein [Oceanobacillus halophilus]RKQ35624.1 hypothetical protein D8M06_04970 [Oceanobacillus halophilus]
MERYHSAYQSIKEWHDENTVTYQSSADKLQLFHQIMMRNIFEITLDDMIKEYGLPPCDYTWFVTGSAGRLEQGVYSDQDHGIIYKEKNERVKSYFLTFGEKLSSGLHYVGYPLCVGNVMSSNPLWCQSLEEWEWQVNNWIYDNSWKSLRYLLIFYDARIVIGDESMVPHLKQCIHHFTVEHPILLTRFLENTKRSIQALGLFHQLLMITTGPYTGCMNIKEVAIFPYVNTIRLLSILEGIMETSTLERMRSLKHHSFYAQILKGHDTSFMRLLQLNLKHSMNRQGEGHQYVNIFNLNQEEKLELKAILKNIKKLQKRTEIIIKRAARK